MNRLALAFTLAVMACEPAPPPPDDLAIPAPPIPPTVVVVDPAPVAILRTYTRVAAQEHAAVMSSAATPGFVASVITADAVARAALQALEKAHAAPPALDRARGAVRHLQAVLDGAP